MDWLYVTVFAIISVYSVDRLIRSSVESNKHGLILSIISLTYSIILICKLV